MPELISNGTMDQWTPSNISQRFITHYVLTGGVNDVYEMAEWMNELQRHVLDSGLGIPIIVSTDPQHSWTTDTALSFASEAFSRWPETMALAALRDSKLTRQFAYIIRKEYVSVSIRQGLHPQIDLAMESRWGRIWCKLQ